MMAFSLVFILSAVLLVFALIVVSVTFLIFKKEKATRLKASAEAEKINKLLADGKISEAEAAELKKAVGAYPISDDKKNIADTHILVTGILHITNGIFGIFIMIAVLLVFCITIFQVSSAAPQGGPLSQIAFHGLTMSQASIYPPERKVIFSMFPLAFIFLLLLLMTIPQIIGGIYLIKRKNWARYLTIAYSILGILSFPIGTALGIYSLWALLIREEAGSYFIAKK